MHKNIKLHDLFHMLKLIYAEIQIVINHISVSQFLSSKLDLKKKKLSLSRTSVRSL